MALSIGVSDWIQQNVEMKTNKPTQIMPLSLPLKTTHPSSFAYRLTIPSSYKTLWALKILPMIPTSCRFVQTVRSTSTIPQELLRLPPGRLRAKQWCWSELKPRALKRETVLQYQILNSASKLSVAPITSLGW
jgi:hypothetical protein